MKTVCRVLGVARSHVHELHHRSEDCRDGRKGRTPADDAQLLAQIQEQITDLPRYGYRCACAAHMAVHGTSRPERQASGIVMQVTVDADELDTAAHPGRQESFSKPDQADMCRRIGDGGAAVVRLFYP